MKTVENPKVLVPSYFPNPFAFVFVGKTVERGGKNWGKVQMMYDLLARFRLFERIPMGKSGFKQESFSTEKGKQEKISISTSIAFLFYHVGRVWKNQFPVISLRSDSTSAAKMGSLIIFFFTQSEEEIMVV